MLLSQWRALVTLLVALSTLSARVAPSRGAPPEGILAQGVRGAARQIIARTAGVEGLFTTDERLNSVGVVARRWLAAAADHGLDLVVPDEVDAFEARPDPATRAAAEAALMASLGRLAAALPARPSEVAVLADKKSGYYLSPDTLWRDAPAPEPGPELMAALGEAARAERLDAWLKTRTPSHTQYRGLVEASRRYRALCEAGGWAPVKRVRGRKGSRWRDREELERVQARLALEGFLPGPPSGVYDDAMREAVARYRRARGMRGRAWYDEEVAAALSVPCEARLAQIRLNIRRWRHSAWRGEATRIEVNLAGAEVRYFRDGALVSRHRAVVGSNRRSWSRLLKRKVMRSATPVMQDSLTAVVLNPEWTVPARIVREELEPRLAREGPEYLARHHYRVTVAGNGQEMYVQARGPDNALGQVKFAFPNSERIYLHDTNKRGYFRYTERAFSHGCVRVEGAQRLAIQLIKDDYARHDKRVSRRHLEELLGDHDRTYWYALDEPIPVLLEYYTASVEGDGTVWFHPDLYGYDAESRAWLATRK